MNKLVKLKESDLINLVNKIIKEQKEFGSDEFEEYAYEIEQIYQSIFALNPEDVTEEDIDYAKDELSQLLTYAENDDNISDDEFEELYDICDEMMRDMDFELPTRRGLDEQMEESQNYMFFSNLEQIKRQCEKLLELDPHMIDDIINNGHDWADDHVTEAKTNMDQVFDFLMNETKKQKQYVDYEDIHEGRKKTGTKLCARGKAAAKSKFKVYPSAYANGYAVSVCKGRIKGLDGKKHCSGAYC
jgi:hypothetical protein